jgi:diguanylate cyclase (GGDEF)-like protein
MATTLEIVQVCEILDAIAVRTYRRLAQLAREDKVRALWESMAAAEAQHVAFWRRIVSVGRTQPLPEVFSDPAQVLSDMQALVPQAEALFEQTQSESAVLAAPFVALRLEFSMLNPSFEILFHLLRPLGGDLTPADDYQDHILQLGELAALQSEKSPELRLMADMLQQLWKRNRHLALHAAIDPLTEAFNRRSFEALFCQLCQLAAPRGESVGLLMADVDDFKRVNDAMGHATGDLVLREVADAMRASLRASDVLGRYGGDEFVLCLAPIQPASLGEVAEKARSAVQALLLPQGLRITLSLGGCVARADSAAPLKLLVDLLQRADKQLYQAKALGKDHVCIC